MTPPDDWAVLGARMVGYAAGEAALARLREREAQGRKELGDALYEMRERAEAAEARVARLTEALRNGVEIAGHFMDTDGRGDLDGWLDSARSALAHEEEA